MPEKRSKSILSGLKNMLHLESEKSSKPVPKSSASTRKKTAPAEKRAPPAQEAKERPAEKAPATLDAAPDSKPEKKKVQNQPWYRHRQRW